jgi:hypothetical protein
MILSKSKRTPEERKKYVSILGTAAQLALVLGIALGRMEIPNIDFLIGILYGFAIVGNLAFISQVARKESGGQHD